MVTLDDIKSAQTTLAQISESIESGEKVIKDGKLTVNGHNSTKPMPQDDVWMTNELTGESVIIIHFEVSLLTMESKL